MSYSYPYVCNIPTREKFEKIKEYICNPKNMCAYNNATNIDKDSLLMSILEEAYIYCNCRPVVLDEIVRRWYRIDGLIFRMNITPRYKKIKSANELYFINEARKEFINYIQQTCSLLIGNVLINANDPNANGIPIGGGRNFKESYTPNEEYYKDFLSFIKH